MTRSARRPVRRFPIRRLPVIVVATLTFGLAVTAAAVDIEKIGSGRRRVDVTQHLVDDKFVVVDFYADWCRPCRDLAPRLERIIEAYPDHVALRKIDIRDWKSPVVAQYDIGAIPYLQLYGRDGVLLAKGDPPTVLGVLKAAIEPDGDVIQTGGTAAAGLRRAVTSLVVLGGFFWMLARASGPRAKRA